MTLVRYNPRFTTLGVDPGPSEHGAVLYDTLNRRILGKWELPAKELLLATGALKVNAVIIEKPVTLPQVKIRTRYMDETIAAAGALAYLYGQAGFRVCLVPAQALKAQMGYSTKDGNADKWLKSWLIRFGYDVSRDGASNTHLRAALRAAMFNVDAVQNAKYLATAV